MQLTNRFYFTLNFIENERQQEIISIRAFISLTSLVKNYMFTDKNNYYLK